MLNQRTRLLVLSAALASSIPISNASAQQFSPLSVVPAVNMTLAVDQSHEMALVADGSAYMPGLLGNRLAFLRDTMVGGGPTDTDAAIFPFRNQFLWSGFAYSGAHFAKIKDGSGNGIFNTFNTIRTTPGTQTPASITTSFNNLSTMIGTLRPDHCNATKGRPACTENVLPGGASLTCITPTSSTNCSGDEAVLVAVMNGGLSGFTLPVGLSTMTIDTEIACDSPTFPSSPGLGPATTGPLNCTPASGTPAIRPICELAHELSYFSWPRFNPPGIGANEVDEQFCGPMEIAFANVQAKLADCLVAAPTVPDLTPADAPSSGPGGYRCIPGNISANICTPASPFNGTCVCDQTDPDCGGAATIDDCGVPMVLRARQQVAMCFAQNDDTTSPIYNALRAQPDNMLRPGGCRSNAIMYVTDGIGGETSGVAGNASENSSVFRTFDPPGPMISIPQNYVVRTGARPQADVMADVIQDTLLDGNIPPIENTRNEVRAMLGRINQRNLRGTYTAANITVDRFETRAAFFLYEVPGAPDRDNDVYSAYLGRPSRIAMHAIRADGSIDPAALWESDYTTRAGMALGGGPSVSTYLNFLPGAPTGADPAIGPSGTWAGGMQKEIARNTGGSDRLDRNGDGAITAADVTREAIRWGHMLGGENAAPLIIEAATEVTNTGLVGATLSAQFQNIRAVRERPSQVVAYTNGWIVGLNGGESTTGYNFGNQSILRTYRDDPAPGPRYDASGNAGQELYRVRPSFIYAAGNPSSQLVSFNDSIQQPLMNGHMTAREVLMTSIPEKYSTVLIFTQGSAGRGIGAIDVSDPQRGGLTIAGDPLVNAAYSTTDGIRPMWEVLLPDSSDRATAKPVIYSFPQLKTGGLDSSRVTVLVTVGGAGGSNNIYGYRVRDGALIAQTTLPGAPGQSYRTAPSCIDIDGRGASHCYLVRSDGLLVRVPIDRNNGTFGTATSLSPVMMGAGRTFWTEPVVTFSQDNSVIIFAASGDINALQSSTSANNYMFKVVDSSFSRAAGTVDINNACSPSSSSSRSGRIAFDNDREMVLSPPTLVKGVLGFTTYLPGADGCTPGQAKLYTMNFETCYDSTRSSTNRRPAGRNIGTGLPTSPTILHRVEAVFTHTSKEPTAGQVRTSLVNSKGATLLPIQKSYYAPLRKVQ